MANSRCIDALFQIVYMPRPDVNRIGTFFHNYISQVPQDDVIPALRELGNGLHSLMASVPEEKRDFAYAPGKWSLREVFQHIIDTERILCFRALSIAREEPKPLPAFDENHYVARSKAGNRKWADLLDEFKVVRQGSVLMFASFDKDQMEATGIANNNPLYVLGLGFIIAGHCQHHYNIIRDRYLAL